MKIALIGYGKMGRAIEAIALSRGHSVPLKISSHNLQELKSDSLREADAAIEFTGPESAYDNIIRGLDAGIPVVCGSTGWLTRLEEVRQYCRQTNGSFLYASNFSVDRKSVV